MAGASGDKSTIIAAERWCTRELAPLIEGDAKHRERSALLLG
jgi:hypothetical protein